MLQHNATDQCRKIWNSFQILEILVLALGSRYKGSSAASAESLVVDEEKMKPGHWLLSVLCVHLSTLTLLVG